tara:strand:- start:888 stop:1208 length:321 start_codon:yes stop_codon:yes gene_type:complete
VGVGPLVVVPVDVPVDEVVDVPVVVVVVVVPVVVSLVSSVVVKVGSSTVTPESSSRALSSTLQAPSSITAINVFIITKVLVALFIIAPAAVRGIFVLILSFSYQSE